MQTGENPRYAENMYSENRQQFYRSAPMPKCDFN